MTHTAKHDISRAWKPASSDAPDGTVERFSQLVAERVRSLSHGNEKIIVLAERALREARAALSGEVTWTDSALPVSMLKASELIAQGLADLSQATMYRGVESKRFYCTTPKGRSRSIGKGFPTWQFVEPVPELLETILNYLAELPSSDIHSFWVTASDELNELSPAELLAGKPFETRHHVHPSQRLLLAQPTNIRLRNVRHVAALHITGMAEIMG